MSQSRLPTRREVLGDMLAGVAAFSTLGAQHARAGVAADDDRALIAITLDLE